AVLNGQIVTVTGLLGTSAPYTGFTANFTTADYDNPSDSGIASFTAATDFFFFGLTGDCTEFLPLVNNGCVVALSSDPADFPTASVNVVGGPSGIIVDNYSTAAQASSIYFTALSVNVAFKYTQDGLQ